MESGVAEQVLQHVRGQREDLIELLGRMVDAESPSSTPDSHQLILSVLHEAFGSLDFAVRMPRVANAHRHFYARQRDRQRGTPTQLVVGHYDTVWPIGTLSKRPFTVDDNVIRGPGVFDMKGGLTQIVMALRTIRELDLQMPVKPVVFINSDE